MVSLRKLLPRFSLRTLAIFPLLVTCAVALWLHWEPWYEVYCVPSGDDPLLMVQAACFSPREDLVAISDAFGAPLVLIDAKTGEEFRHMYGCRPAQFVRWYGEEAGEPLDDPPVIRPSLCVSVAFSVDGRMVAAGYYSRWRSWVMAWDVSSGEAVLSPEVAGIPTEVGFSPDGRRLLARVSKRYDIIGPDGERATPTNIRAWPLTSGGKPQELKDENIPPECSAKITADGLRKLVIDDWRMSLLRRRRPEWWWGVFWLWEFWLTAAFAGLFVWSVWRDRRALARVTPSPLVGEGGDGG